jgi:hypothetical protein
VSLNLFRLLFNVDKAPKTRACINKCAKGYFEHPVPALGSEASVCKHRGFPVAFFAFGFGE